jgi:AraC-like DNA-binding protein
MSIGELERHTGYSRRYLDRLFQQHVGLSPKVLAEIFRFSASIENGRPACRSIC